MYFRLRAQGKNVLKKGRTRIVYIDSVVMREFSSSVNFPLKMTCKEKGTRQKEWAHDQTCLFVRVHLLFLAQNCPIVVQIHISISITALIFSTAIAIYCSISIAALIICQRSQYSFQVGIVICLSLRALLVTSLCVFDSRSQCLEDVRGGA